MRKMRVALNHAKLTVPIFLEIMSARLINERPGVLIGPSCRSIYVIVSSVQGLALDGSQIDERTRRETKARGQV